MAEAVLKIVFENLNSLIQKELGLFLGFHQEMKRLSSLITTIETTLEDAEEKHFSNRFIKDWLQKLKDASYELDDIMDEYSYEALGLEYQGVKCGVSEISERLQEIAEERTKFHLIEMMRERRSEVIEWRQTNSFMTEPRVYGREKDKDKIVDFLVGDASHYEDLSVYPIVGLGGLGKTTLVQLIFNHERLVKHFVSRIWVCVWEDFSLKRMKKTIIEAASGHACENLELEPLQRRLQDLLQRKRDTLVLDDMWDDKQLNWQRLTSVLACEEKGASILVTTRLPTVAAVMGIVPPHELSMLFENDC